MKKVLLFLLIILFTEAKGQTITLSPQAEISVITCGRSPLELYTAFGHSAIRVFDPVNRIDYVYNYGVFDFDQPNFYLNYTRGRLFYKLGVYAYPDFVNSYVYYNRWVTEQVLNLSNTQKQRAFDYLEWNALPENETYRYDYFYNNCANKVRDVLAEILKDSVQFDDSYITNSYTIRQLTDLYLFDQPWGDLGIDICLGLPMDKKASPYEYMFLPDYVMQAFDHATVNQGGPVEPLVKQKLPVFLNTPKDPPRSLIPPLVAFGVIGVFAIALSVYDNRRKRLSIWFDTILFTLTGAVGLLLLVLWLATDHKAAANNFNLLWAVPTHLLVWGLFFKSFRLKLKKYFLFAAILSGLLLLTWLILPQQLNYALMPLAAALGARSFILWQLLPGKMVTGAAGDSP